MSYQFPNYSTVENVLERGQEYSGYYKGKTFSVRETKSGGFLANIKSRHSILRDNLRDLMDELRRDIDAMGTGFVL